ncbi:protein kinase [Nocardia sp. ET3-3]|uniref:Serine/threonine-protein kinase PknK n=1 Tax=Nocardia terrae TaxID=2675851 RepID=A0A7K1V298_9NOCA|nr:serine/threonine-protein kinase [Nocardia terrae]MVU80734.1 protein kinase [Nocardia terrae]
MNDATQRQQVLGIEAELEAEGFEGAELIGRGGFGAVYRCRERALDRDVAVKIVDTKTSDADLQRFLREQRALGRLSGHPNIVTVLHVDVTATGRPYLVMPYHPAGSLHDRITRDGPLDYPDVLRLGIKLSAAMETAHRNGILHRDVKPANILITDYGEPQLCDFGIAHGIDGFQTATGEITGSPAFTAPEVLAGRSSSVQSDIYGLGATLFSALTGHAAFERMEGEDLVAQFIRISRQTAVLPLDLPEGIAGLVETAMARNPGNRPRSAYEFGTAIRDLQQHLGLPQDDLSVMGTADPAASVSDNHGKAVPRRASTPPPTPNTRFRPPHPTRALVARARVMAPLKQQERKRLVVIHAPAGFGKSSLAAQWAEYISGTGVLVVWLTLDAEDNNAITFCTHLVEAVHRVEPALAHDLRNALEEAGGQAERFVLTTLINKIHDLDRRLAIVVDDWHQVTSESTRNALRFLLEKGCHHLQLIITTRTRSGLPLAGMRVRNELVEIDAAALRFTDDEAAALLSGYDGLRVTPTQVSELTHSTEGWVAALQLASLSLQHRTDSTSLLTNISGRHQAIGDFLAENVLDSLEPALVDFMMATSLTRRISGDLANTLTQETTGQARLDEVEERNLFLQRLDDNGEWFRYHHLFAEYLQRRLERDQPDRLPELHRRAAQWFIDHGHIADAVRHTLATGDQLRAAQLVEQAGFTLLEDGQPARLLGLVEALPDDVAETLPHLQTAVALANIALRHDLEAKEALKRVYVILDRSHADADSEHLRNQCGVIEAVTAMLSDHTVGVEDLIAAPLSAPESFDPWFVSTAGVVSAYLALMRFDFEGAKQWRDRVSSLSDTTSGQLTRTYLYCFSGIAAHEQLDIPAAEYYFRKAQRVAQVARGSSGIAARLAGALLGALLYERDELDEAESLLDASFELGATAGTVDFMIAGYAIGARVKAVRGNRDEALHRLEEGARTAKELALPRLAAAVECERIRLGLATDSESLSIPVDFARGSKAGTDADELIGDILLSNRIRTILNSGSSERITAIVGDAAALVAKLTTQQRRRARLNAEILLAQCLSIAGEDDQAMRLATGIENQCRELGITRLLLDAGPVFGDLIDRR